MITLSQALSRNPLIRLAEPVNFRINRGEQIAIVGINGSGKSILTDMITGKLPLIKGSVTYDFSPSASNTAYDNIKQIAFRDTYGAADTSYYYQQRWNSQDKDESPDVALSLHMSVLPIHGWCECELSSR